MKKKINDFDIIYHSSMSQACTLTTCNFKTQSMRLLRLATIFGISPRMRLDLLVNNFVYEAVTNKYLEIFEGKFKRNFKHFNKILKISCFCYVFVSCFLQSRACQKVWPQGCQPLRK